MQHIAPEHEILRAVARWHEDEAAAQRQRFSRINSASASRHMRLADSLYARAAEARHRAERPFD